MNQYVTGTVIKELREKSRMTQFKGLAHAELVMMFPERFALEVKRFLSV